MVERKMNNYIANLRKLVCGDETTNSCQVQDLVERVIRKEYWVDNGQRPNGTFPGTGRVKDLLTDKDLSNPKYLSKSIDDRTTALQHFDSDDDRSLNNNPNYRPNLIDVLNTPFDHIERIVLQDFSSTMLDDGNYFKELFTFPADGNKKYNGGFAGFTMADPSNLSDYSIVNNKFQPGDESDPDANCNIGGFFIDSFTYTPFVDYSQVGEGGDP